MSGDACRDGSASSSCRCAARARRIHRAVAEERTPLELRFLVCHRCSVAALSPPADDAGKDRDEDHQEYDYLDVPVDSGNISSQEIAGEQHAPYPKKRAEYADREKLTIWHSSDSSDDGSKRPDDWHELREDHGLASVTSIKQLGAQKVLLIEQERALASKNPRAGGPADQVPARVAADSCRVQHDAKQVHVEHSARRDESGSDEERVAGKKKDDQQAGFGEDDRSHADVPGPFDERGKVGEIRKQLTKLIH